MKMRRGSGARGVINYVGLSVTDSIELSKPYIVPFTSLSDLFKARQVAR